MRGVPRGRPLRTPREVRVAHGRAVLGPLRADGEGQALRHAETLRRPDYCHDEAGRQGRSDSETVLMIVLALLGGGFCYLLYGPFLRESGRACRKIEELERGK